jgi:hypothetical protein
VNLVGRDAKRSGSEDPILTCKCLYVVDFADKYRPAYSGGGSVANKTSDNGANPSRWMAHEAMLAGLEMTPLWGGIKAKDLQPNIGEDSMTLFYRLIERLYFIKWEDHSESDPPLLTGDKLPACHFSRSVVSFSLVSILSKRLRYEGVPIANAPGRYTTTKSCIHLCACTMTCPRYLSPSFPNHGSINLGCNTAGKSSSSFSTKRT